MNMHKITLRRYLATTSYIGMIVFLNALLVYLPGVSAFGQSFFPADMLVRSIYIVRDFAQREIKHYIFIAMLVGTVLSYLLADKKPLLSQAYRHL